MVNEMDNEALGGVTGREVQPSYDMLIGEDFKESRNNIPGFRQTTNFHPNYATNAVKKKKKRTISTFFSDMSRLGMSYEDKVIENMRAIPADKSLLPKDQTLPNDIFSQLISNWKVKDNKDKSFFEKDFPLKREALRKLA